MARQRTAHGYELELKKMIKSRTTAYKKIVHICQERIRQLEVVESE